MHLTWEGRRSRDLRWAEVMAQSVGVEERERREPLEARETQAGC